jgi:hypothetical protein
LVLFELLSYSLLFPNFTWFILAAKPGRALDVSPPRQLAPRNVPPQWEPQHDSPQEDELFEIMVTVPAGEDSQEAQPMSQNHDHDQQEEETNEKEEEEGNKAEGEDDEDYTPSSNAEKDETFHVADEIKTFGNEAPIPTGRLRDLLNHINIITPP